MLVAQQRQRGWAPGPNARVDPSHPLAAGLISFVVPGIGDLLNSNTLLLAPSADCFVARQRLRLSTAGFDAYAASSLRISGVPPTSTVAIDIACSASTLLAVPTNFGIDTSTATNGGRRAFLVYSSGGVNKNIYVWGESADFDTGVTWPTDNIPHQIVAVFPTASTVRVYRDALQIGSGSLTGSLVTIPSSPIARWQLGSAHPGGSVNNAGSIGWAALWARALSANEVAMLYADPFCMTE